MAVPIDPKDIAIQVLRLMVRSLAALMFEVADQLEAKYKTDREVMEIINELRMSAQVAMDAITKRGKEAIQ